MHPSRSGVASRMDSPKRKGPTNPFTQRRDRARPFEDEFSSESSSSPDTVYRIRETTSNTNDVQHLSPSSHYNNDSKRRLLKRIRQLETQVRELQGSDQEQKAPAPTQNVPTLKEVYRLNGTRLYLGSPYWILANKRQPFLSCDAPIADIDAYLDENPNIVTMVYHDFSSDFKEEIADAVVGGVLPAPKQESESLVFVASALHDAVHALTSQIPDFDSLFPNFDVLDEVPSPYLLIHHALPAWDDYLRSLSSTDCEYLNVVKDYVQKNFSPEYEEAGIAFKSGLVSHRFMPYLFKPGDVLCGMMTGHLSGFMAVRWPRGLIQNKSATQTRKRWEIRCWTWEYSGSFSKQDLLLTVELDTLSDTELVQISGLAFHPVRFAHPDTLARLEYRGATFWKCRHRNFVTCRISDNSKLNILDERYMIDTKTYRRLHPSPTIDGTADKMSETMMASDTPPSGGKLLLFPPMIAGFNLRLKKWIDLEVDTLTDVQWNRKAFESLVVEPDTKKLILALVSSHVAAERSADLIQGKGNGLIILLHGGPGTGKTFTAESVAEIAEKPLYRVTCGDIGTKPEDVERYLESVLHLGKIWDCVVLLDEADVFLEERSLADLQRNALVSVFLRVLEYYEGILILTSNRVGTFDAAFKSRIQLALHYQPLSLASRRKIWRNFLNHLSSQVESGMDLNDIFDHIDDLASEEMNGRQIRNAITTARQLAQFEKQEFSYAHLRHTLDVSGRFDKYLKDINEGFTEDEIARSDKVR